MGTRCRAFLFCIVSPSQFVFEFLNRRQTAFQIRRERFGQSVLGNADGRCRIPESVLCDDLVLGLADDQANTRPIIGMAEQVIDGGEVEIHLADKLRLEFFRLQIHDDKAAQFQVIEEKIDKEITSAHFQAILAGNECKADAQLQQEVSQVCQ